MPSYVLPLGTVLYQCFFILISIAIEALVLRRGLRLAQRKSVEYATSMNLLCVTIGWLIFFIGVNAFNQQIEPAVISYVLFDRLFGGRTTYFWLLALIVFTFLGTFLIKFLGLNGLQLLLGEKSLNIDTPSSPKEVLKGGLHVSLEGDVGGNLAEEAKAVLWANACSSTAILVVLVVRWSWIHQISN